VKRETWKLKLYRYVAGELAPEERARRRVPRISASGRVLYWHLGRWVYCARVAKS
jgi:hypothetical protein